jgi:DNA-binding transcriptional LysR family regulator
LKNIETFLAVVNTNCSVSEAAEKLFITQTAVTKRISNLEKNVNIKLFIRKNNRLFLSDAGKSFFEYAKGIHQLWSEATDKLSHYNSETIGLVRIATSMQAGRLLPPMIKTFKETYPKVSVELSFHTDNQINQLIFQNEIDIAIAHSSRKNKISTIYEIPLAKHEVVIATPKDFKMIAHSNESIIKSLSNLPCLRLLKGSALDNITTDFLNQVSSTNTHNSQSMFFHRIGMLQLIIDLIELGLGWSIIPKAITTEKMDVYEFPGSKIYEDTFILCQDKSKLNKPSIKFIEMLTDYVNNNQDTIKNLNT